MTKTQARDHLGRFVSADWPPPPDEEIAEWFDWNWGDEWGDMARRGWCVLYMDEHPTRVEAGDVVAMIAETRWKPIDGRFNTLPSRLWDLATPTTAY